MLTYERNVSHDLVTVYYGNYDIVRCIAFALVLLQHFFAECLRVGIIIPKYAFWLTGGGNNNGECGKRIVLSAFRIAFMDETQK